METDDHARFHKARKVVAQTETFTKTFYQTVIWVDSSGAVVSTQINTPSPATTISSSVAAKSTSPAPSAAAPGNPSPNVSAAKVVNETPAPAPADKPIPIPTAPAPAPAPAPVSASSPINAPSQAAAPVTAPDSKAATGSSALGGMGICYDLIAADSSCKSSSQMSSDFSYLKSQGYGMVRTYDIGCDLGKVRDAAIGAGVSLMIGLNSIANLQADLAKLVALMHGNWAGIDTIYIGNELVNSGQASADAVAAAVTTARGILKGAGYNANVVTVDTFVVMRSNPTICSTSDYCAANAHAFFDPNTAASGAGVFVLNAYNAVKAANGGKRTVITESGWPYKGGCNGKACPGIAEQKAAVNGIISSFAGNAGSMYLFMAYDATYKAAGMFGVEPYFGIYDQSHYSGGIGLK